MMNIGSYLPLLGASLVTSLFLCFLVLKTKDWHGRWTRDSSTGVQKFHEGSVLRVGGVAIFLSVALSIWVFIPSNLLDTLADEIFFSGTLVFVVGLLEDTTKRISPRWRLWVVMVAAFIMIACTDVWLTHLDIMGVDQLLIVGPPIAIMFTIFAVVGLVNAINIVDGFNGLASGIVMMAFTIFGVMAYEVQDQTLAILCAVMVACILGFFIFNYPFGKIFLGDAGAYFLGFVLAWVAILLPERHAEISPWASLMVCAYPVTEVLYSMARRRLRRVKSVDPDAEHLHSLIKKYIVRVSFSHLRNWQRNALVAPCIWLVSVLLGLVGYWQRGNPLVLMFCFVAWVLWYRLTYRWLVKRGEQLRSGN